MAAALQRTLQLGLLAGQLVRLKGKRAGARGDLHRRISQRLGLMHGLPQKIGQLLAFSELDSSDPIYTGLTESEPTLPPNEAMTAIERELSHCPIAGKVSFRTERVIKGLAFRELSPNGISASIGQVHRGVLLDGRQVAVKVQYPGIADHLETDLKALGWLMSPVGNLRKGFNVQAYRQEIGAMLGAELDYHREAGWLKRFAAAAADMPEVCVPEVIDDLSGARLLTMTWLEGDRLAEAREWPVEQRTRIARALLRLFLRGCFEWGFLHADPHPGNYRFRQGPDGSVQVGLLDFGCVKELEGAMTNGLLGLIQDLQQDRLNEARAWHRHQQMGFDVNLLAPVRERLVDLVALLCEPFTTRGPFDVRRWNLRERAQGILGEHRLAYRLAGPPTMIYLLRSFQGLVQYLAQLEVPLDWRRELAEWLVSEGNTAFKQRPQPTDNSPGMSATSLHIEVLDHGQQKVRLQFGARATDNLPDLVPVELLPKLQSRGIDLHRIARDAGLSGYAPAELFALDDGAKRIRVWIA